MYRLISYLITASGLAILLFGLVCYLGSLIPGQDSSSPEILIYEQNELFVAKLMMFGGFSIALAGYACLVYHRRKMVLNHSSEGLNDTL
jgi:hypothetical protein